MPRLSLAKCSLALALCLLTIPATATAQQVHPKWSYDGSTDPSHCGGVDPAFAVCSAGRAQSPIDIKGPKKSDLPALKMSYNAVLLNIIDNGQAVLINYPAGSTLTVGDKTYTFK